MPLTRHCRVKGQTNLNFGDLHSPILSCKVSSQVTESHLTTVNFGIFGNLEAVAVHVVTLLTTEGGITQTGSSPFRRYTHTDGVGVVKAELSGTVSLLRFPTCQCDKDLPSKCGRGEQPRGNDMKREMLCLSCRFGIRTQFCLSIKQN